MKLRQFIRQNRAATAVEYGILGSLIALAIISAAAPLGQVQNNTFTTLAETISTGKSATPQSSPLADNDSDKPIIGVQRRDQTFGPAPPPGAFGAAPEIEVVNRNEAFGPPMAGQSVEVGATVEIGVVMRDEQFGPFPETSFK